MKNSKAGELYALEQLSGQNTVIHRLHPLAKLLGCLLYLVCLISLDRYALERMAPFLLYPVLVLTLGEIPLGMVLRRCLIALPFCLFAGCSNLILDRTVISMLGPVPVTGGLVSCLGILLKTLLAVSAVLTLIAVTPFSQLTGQLRRLHVPGLLVALLEMTYRYVGTLLEEGERMATAYSLRSGGKNALELRHMGSFVGSLLLRSFDRAERIYGAMKCRGYGGTVGLGEKRPMEPEDVCYLLLVCGTTVLFRLLDIPALLGGLFV